MIISTVVPRALHNLEVLASNYFNVEPLVAGRGKADYAIDIDVDPAPLAKVPWLVAAQLAASTVMYITFFRLQAVSNAPGKF